MLNNNNVLKVVSIVLAICLWAFVMGEVNPTIKKTIHNVPVEFTNVETIEEQGIALLDPNGYTVDVEVEGSRSDLNTMDVDDIQVTADLFGYSIGEHHIAVDVALPDGIYLEEVKDSEILVTLEELVSVQKSVDVDFTGDLPEGMEPGHIVVYPETVEVKGAKSIVNQVESVRVQIDAAKLTEDVATFTASPAAIDENGEIIKNVDISANTIEVQTALYNTKTVPLEVKVTGSPDQQLGTADVTIPKTITIRGTEEALADVDQITAADIDISHIEQEGTLSLELDLPYGIETADRSKNIGIKIEFK